MIYFNSIKVQLKRTQPQFVVAPSTFQFHKGTIKAGTCAFFQCPPRRFQFHKGTIKAPSDVQDYANYLNFNSIKVQLKLDRLGLPY